MFRSNEQFIYLETIVVMTYNKVDRTKQHVAIIGCGASGLVTLKELLDEGHTGIIFERTMDIGGIFQTAYREGQMVSSTAITLFSDFLGSDGEHLLTHPRMLTFVEYCHYLKEYAVHFNLLPHIRFGYEVQQIERWITDEEQWFVKVKRKISDAEWYQNTFDRVAICSGTHQKRTMPMFVGLERFQGKIKHMQDIETFEELRDKRICIIGSGESGSEIALAASKYGQRTVVSIRRDHGYLVSRYPFGLNEPSDLQTTRVRYSIPMIFAFFQVLVRLCFEKFSLWFDPIVNESSFKIECQVFNMNLKQIRTSHFRNTYGTKSAGLAEAILYHNCTIKPAIKLIKEHSIVFVDDSEEEIDEIICCTGFQNRFAFLDCVDNDPILKQVGSEARIGHNLYKHAIHPLLGDSLVFIGFVRPSFGAVPPLAEMQARWFALLCSRKRQLPDSITMNERIAIYVRFITKLFTPFRTERITTLTDFLSFSDDLAREIGCRPKLGWTTLFFDPYLWLRSMIGPISNAQYRLHGPHANPKQARQILLKMKWKPLWYNFFELALLYVSTILWYCGLSSCQPHAWCAIHERNID